MSHCEFGALPAICKKIPVGKACFETRNALYLFLIPYRKYVIRFYTVKSLNPHFANLCKDNTARLLFYKPFRITHTLSDSMGLRNSSKSPLKFDWIQQLTHI